MGDYDRKPMEPPSQFLRLKSKGETARFRIASSPYRELRVWPVGGANEPPLKAEITANFSPGQWLTLLRDPGYDVKEVYHFVVIDRNDGGAKIFTTTGGVYGRIRDFANNNEWGDPRGYDLTVIRTEQPGKNYYQVDASPNKSSLASQELAKADTIDMGAKLPAALPASAAQPDDIDDSTEAEPLPWDIPVPQHANVAPIKPAVDYPAKVREALQPAVPDAVIEDVPDGDLNLDDIPF